jgi:ABC-type glycerol-3-phosphate transport system substrate-binding protein
MVDWTMSHKETRERGVRGVSRRDFVRAAGASGVAVGLSAGPVGAVTSQGATVQWSTDQFGRDNADAIESALREAGLSDDVSLDVVAGPQNTDDRRTQFQQALSSGRSDPDVLMMDSGWTIPFISREQILDLSENLSSDTVSMVEDEYFDASVNTARDPRSGDLFGVPLFPDFPTMLYRKDLVEEAGFDPEGNNWATESMSWQRFSEVVSTTMEQTDIDMGFTFQADIYEGLACCDFNEFMSSFGGTYFDGLENLFGPIGERPVTVNEQPVVDSIEMVRTFVHGPDANATSDDFQGPISPEAVLQWTELPSLNPFENGNAVANRNWPFAIERTGGDDAFGENLGVMPIPYGVTPENAQYEGTGGPAAALGGWHNAVNPNSNNVEAAVEVVEAFTAENVQLTLFEEIGWLPPKRSLFESDRASEVPILGRYIETLGVAGENAIPRPVTAVWPTQSERIAQQVNSAYSQDGQPQQIMDQLASQLEQIEQSA